MNVERTALDAEEEGYGTPGIGTRLISLAALLGLVTGIAWLLFSLVSLFTDSWVAPANLSPDNDRVIALNVQITRQMADVERAEAELVRVEQQIGAIDASLARLDELSGNTRDMFLWGADVQGRSAQAIQRSVGNLRQQRATLVRLRDRQRERTARTRTQLAEGLVGRRELDAAEQALDQLELQIANTDRGLNEARIELEQARLQADTFQHTADGDADAEAPSIVRGQMPEVVRRQEAMMRIELEVIELQAERRGLVSMREVAQRNLTRMSEALDQVRSRPLYQATQRSLDVAFVPYEQLEGVQPGDDVVQCTWGIFACHRVGTIREVLPGEVVTQDPWGEMARGQFAVLDLTDSDAVMERILRVSSR